MSAVRARMSSAPAAGPYLPIGRYGPHPERLRQQFEGVLWRFRAGAQWREMPQEFGAWPTVHNLPGQNA
ncbi:transposase [Streptomyces sp. NPDC002671]